MSLINADERFIRETRTVYGPLTRTVKEGKRTRKNETAVGVEPTRQNINCKRFQGETHRICALPAAMLSRWQAGVPARKDGTMLYGPILNTRIG